MEMEENKLSLIDESTRDKIRTLWLKGLDIRQIQKELNIAEGTWDHAYYKNYHGFRDFCLTVKKQAILQSAEKVSAEIMATPSDGNAKILSIKQKEAEFLRETIGKELGYTKRIETIGFNVNKNEPLDAEQREKLDKILRASGNAPLNATLIVETSENMAQQGDVTE